MTDTGKRKALCETLGDIYEGWYYGSDMTLPNK